MTVPTIGDGVSETNETFSLNLSAATAGVIADTKGTATVVDPGGLISATVNDVWVAEGNSADFNVMLSAPPATGQTVSLAVTIGGGTATSGADYATTSVQTITFASGETSHLVSVPITADGAVRAERNVQRHALGAGRVSAWR